jgi:hypothetical protein
VNRKQLRKHEIKPDGTFRQAPMASDVITVEQLVVARRMSGSIYPAKCTVCGTITSSENTDYEHGFTFCSQDCCDKYFAKKSFKSEAVNE